jgi:DNA modification methylase
MASWEIRQGDSLEVMRGMDAGSLDAIVTSPPYADQRGYEPGELGGRRGNQPTNRARRAKSRRQRSAAPAEWVEWIKPYTAEALRVLSPTGSMMLNLGVVHRDGEEHSCCDDILRDCRAHGWKLLHRRIWHKPNGQVPSSPGYLTSSHEYLLWLAPTISAWRAFEQPVGSQASREVRTPHAPNSAAGMRGLYSGAGNTLKQGKQHELHPDGARPTSVFTCSVGGEPNPDGHPARMPLKLAQHLVALICPPGGLVLDPFSGNATTGVAANRIGRRYLGIELNPEYAEQSRRRLAEDSPLLSVETEDLGQMSIEDAA